MATLAVRRRGLRSRSEALSRVTTVISKQLFRSLTLPLILGAALAFPGFAGASVYVALGDSIAAGYANEPGDSYVDQLGEIYTTELGVDEVVNFAVSGATSDTLLSDQKLIQAVSKIDEPSDTAAVTIDIGGNDANYYCGGKFHVSGGECKFQDNFREILTGLKTALENDPGEERFIAMAYYNPANETEIEASADAVILGRNLKTGLCDAGLDLGLNDVIYQEAGKLGVQVADPYDEFKEHGRAWMADNLHPNATGHLGLVDAFQAPLSPGLCPSVDPGPGPGPDPDPGPVDPAPDTSAPGTKILKRPARAIRKRQVRFTFRSTETGSTFECSVNRSAFRDCRSPKVLRGLRPGRQVFRVRAVDAAGNRDRTPARYRFRVLKRPRPARL